MRSTTDRDTGGIMAKMGRPTKYRKEFCNQLIEHMRDGGSFDSFCGRIEVRRAALYDWLKKHKEFSYAKEVGEELARLYWEEILKKGVNGKLTTETTKISQEVDENGKPIGKRRVEKYTVPATFANSSFIFMMKNRYGWKDKQDHAHELTGKDGGPIQQAQLSRQELVAALREANEGKDDLEEGFD